MAPLLSSEATKHAAMRCGEISSVACVITTVKLQCGFCASPVWAIVYVVTFAQTYTKYTRRHAALQKVGSTEPMEPHLDPPLKYACVHVVVSRIR